MSRDRTEKAKQFLTAIDGSTGSALEALADVGPEALSEAALSKASPEQVNAATSAAQKLSTGAELSPPEQFALEAIIIPDKRPAIDIANGDYQVNHPLWMHFNDEPIKGRLKKAIPSVGRIELPHHPSLPYAGTGFVVGDGLLMTNRHVAEIFAQGLGTRSLSFKPGITAGIDFKRERNRPDTLFLDVVEVAMIHPWWDMALLRVEGLDMAQEPLTLSLLDPEGLVGRDVAVIGYPAFDIRNPADVQNEVFGGAYYVKRLQPGKLQHRQHVASFRNNVFATTHDSSTLGGNSGSAVFDVATGHVVALHFGGAYLEANFAVPTHELARDDRVIGAKVRFGEGAKAEPVEWSDAWQKADGAEGPSQPPARPPRPYTPARTNAGPGAGPGAPTATVGQQPAAVASVTIPLTVTVSLGNVAPAARLQRAPSIVRPAGGDTGFVAGEEAIADSYLDRKGYQANFLGKKPAVDLPLVKRHADDVLDFEFAGKTETELRYQHFSVLMSRERRMCFLSAVNIDGNLSKKSARVGWKWDPRIPKAQQIMNECYGSSPKFSRGHMTRREDPGWGSNASIAKRGNEDSMHVTNATPQMQAFNAPIWLALEDYALEHAREDDMKISVFTGPYFADDDPEMYGVRIPVAFWKIIAFVHDETRKLCATGYQMTQESTLPPGEEFIFGGFTSPQLKVATQVPIRTIEARSGIDFGHLTDVDPLAGQEEAVGLGALRALGSLDEIVFVR